MQFVDALPGRAAVSRVVPIASALSADTASGLAFTGDLAARGVVQERRLDAT